MDDSPQQNQSGTNPVEGPSKKSFEVLLVEDTLSQTALVKRLLGRSERAKFAVTSVTNLAEAVKIISTRPFDVVLLDLGLPDSKGLATLQRMYEAAGTVPIVVFTADSEESLGTELIRLGAQDYVEKNGVDTTSLVRAIIYASERRKLLEKLVETQKIFVAFMENNPNAAFVVTETGEKVYANWQFERSFAGDNGTKYSKDLLVRRTRHEHLRVLQTGAPIETIENVPDQQGKAKNWLVVKFPFEDMNGRRLIGGTAIDVTEMERCREAVRQTRQMFQVMFYDSQMPHAIIGPDFGFRRVNRAYAELLGYTEADLTQLSLKDITHADDWNDARELLLCPSQLHRSSSRLLRKTGEVVLVRRMATVIQDANDNPLFAALADTPLTNLEDNQHFWTVHHYADILQSLPLPAFIVDSDFVPRAANQHWLTMVGCTQKDLDQRLVEIQVDKVKKLRTDNQQADKEEWLLQIEVDNRLNYRAWVVCNWTPPATGQTANQSVIIVLSDEPLKALSRRNIS